MNPSDAALIRGLRTDDPTSLERLMVMYRQCLVHYAEGILGGCGTGEDVVQETFFRLWRHRRGLKLSGSLRALLYTLTRNAAVDERRRSARRAATATVARAPESSPSPLDAAAAAELAHAAESAVASLPARRREAFMLARLEGLTHREVAAAMGVSPQTVANQISAAMATLRSDLGRFGVPHGRGAPRNRGTGASDGAGPDAPAHAMRRRRWSAAAG